MTEYDAEPTFFDRHPLIGMLLFPVLQPLFLIAMGFQWMKRLAESN